MYYLIDNQGCILFFFLNTDIQFDCEISVGKAMKGLIDELIGIHHGFVSHVLADINEPNSTIILQDRCRAIILLKVKDDIKMVVNNTRLVYAHNI